MAKTIMPLTKPVCILHQTTMRAADSPTVFQWTRLVFLPCEIIRSSGSSSVRSAARSGSNSQNHADRKKHEKISGRIKLRKLAAVEAAATAKNDQVVGAFNFTQARKGIAK